MSRRYGDPVEVRCAETDPADPPRPVAFLWRGRVYLVRDVLSRWVEAGAWWRTAAGRLAAPAASTGAAVTGAAVTGAAVTGAAVTGDRWVWRVEAAAGRSAATGVYDLSCRDGRWRLARALD